MSRKVFITESQIRILKEVMDMETINARAEEADKSPTEAQKKAGNYKMGHVIFAGFKITIENAKGSKRYWKDEKGNTGYNLMHNHYGYFSNSLGHDGDHIDVFLGDNQDSAKVYVVDQNMKDGKTFDESKVMLGFDSEKEAKEAYLSNFTKDWKGFRSITGVSKEFFKKWLYDGCKQRKPFADYVDVMKRKINENNAQGEDELTLHADYTDREKKKMAQADKRKQKAVKAAETRKANKLKKQKEEDEAFWAQQREMGGTDLFGNPV